MALVYLSEINIFISCKNTCWFYFIYSSILGKPQNTTIICLMTYYVTLVYYLKVCIFTFCKKIRSACYKKTRHEPE